MRARQIFLHENGVECCQVGENYMHGCPFSCNIKKRMIVGRKRMGVNEFKLLGQKWPCVLKGSKRDWK